MNWFRSNIRTWLPASAVCARWCSSRCRSAIPAMAAAQAPRRTGSRPTASFGPHRSRLESSTSPAQPRSGPASGRSHCAICAVVAMAGTIAVRQPARPAAAAGDRLPLPHPRCRIRPSEFGRHRRSSRAHLPPPDFQRVITPARRIARHAAGPVEVEFRRTSTAGRLHKQASLRTAPDWNQDNDNSVATRAASGRGKLAPARRWPPRRRWHRTRPRPSFPPSP